MSNDHVRRVDFSGSQQPLECGRRVGDIIAYGASFTGSKTWPVVAACPGLACDARLYAIPAVSRGRHARQEKNGRRAIAHAPNMHPLAVSNWYSLVEDGSVERVRSYVHRRNWCGRLVTNGCQCERPTQH
jgi:hypothetical protein